MAWAQYANGQREAGFQTIQSLAHLTGAQVPGGMPEHMVGNRNEPGARSVPRQLFSSWSLITPIVRGMLANPLRKSAIEVVPKKPAPDAGAPNVSMRILEVAVDDSAKTMSIRLAGLAGRTYELELATHLAQVRAEGAKSIRKTASGFAVEVFFEAGADFVENTIVVRY